MTIRPLHRVDTRPLLEMWNAAARFDRLTPELLEEKLWSDPDFVPGMALVCEEQGAMTGFALGVLRPSDRGRTGFIKLIAVDAGRRRQGIGSRLLSAVEKALGDRGAARFLACESAPNYLAPGVDCRYAAAPRFFDRHGYRNTGEACNMTVDLRKRSFETAAEERELADGGIEVRRAVAEDLEGVLALVRAHWPSWRHETLNGLRNDPASLHLALDGSSVIAFSAFDTNNFGTGWFGPMGTGPSARRRGIGRVLFFRCLADIAAQGHRYATIPWVGPVDFYRLSAGAVVSRTFNRYEKGVHR